MVCVAADDVSITDATITNGAQTLAFNVVYAPPAVTVSGTLVDADGLALPASPQLTLTASDGPHAHTPEHDTHHPAAGTVPSHARCAYPAPTTHLATS